MSIRSRLPDESFAPLHRFSPRPIYTELLRRDASAGLHMWLPIMLVLGLVLCTLIAPLYIIYKPPSLLLHYFRRRWPDVLWYLSTRRRIIALTIDDGPSEYTNEILQVLKANDMNATFFVMGTRIPGREAVLQQLIRDDNELGNHAMQDEPSRSLSEVDLTSQIRTVEDMIHDVYASADIQRPRHYFRPGSGFFSTRMRTLLTMLDYKLVLGSIYPHDAQIRLWRLNAWHILSLLRPGRIIVCHERSYTAPMLRRVLPEMKRRGYQAVTVTELLKASQGSPRHVSSNGLIESPCAAVGVPRKTDT